MRDWLWPGLALLAGAAFAAWLAWATEWADRDIRIPPSGEAAANPLYAAQALARELGADVASKTSLQDLPPAGGTLVLSSQAWNLLPGREQALREWVEQGGHLVIPRSQLDDKMEWLPVHEVADKSRSRPASTASPKPPSEENGGDDDDDDNDDDDDSGQAIDAKPAARAVNKPAADASSSKKLTCGRWESYGMDDDDPFAYSPKYNNAACYYLSEAGAAAGQGFRVCAWLGSAQSLEPRSGAVSLWSVNDLEGHALLRRVALGRGSVTVIGPWNAITRESILDADHPRLWAAALQLRPGMALWFVADESRAALLVWLWQQAWAALLLALLALAAWLWRSAPRFGPRQATPRLERRSMAEQIIGTAHFLARGDGQALHQAQLRALGEAAASRLRHWGRLDASARARQLARLTGLPPEAVASALAGGERPPARLETDLCCLETATRRLRLLTNQALTLPDEQPESPC